MRDPKELARLLSVLSVETRVRIVRLLNGRALCVNALAAQLDVTQGAVSQHLRIMRDAGAVIDDRRGNFVHYRLNADTLAAWREEINRLLTVKPSRCAGPKGDTKCPAATTRRCKAAASQTS